MRLTVVRCSLESEIVFDYLHIFSSCCSYALFYFLIVCGLGQKLSLLSYFLQKKKSITIDPVCAQTKNVTHSLHVSTK